MNGKQLIYYSGAVFVLFGFMVFSIIVTPGDGSSKLREFFTGLAIIAGCILLDMLWIRLKNSDKSQNQ